MKAYEVNDSVKFFDSECSTIPVYGTVKKVNPKSVVVSTEFGDYTLRNCNDHIHMLNYD